MSRGVEATRHMEAASVRIPASAPGAAGHGNPHVPPLGVPTPPGARVGPGARLVTLPVLLLALSLVAFPGLLEAQTPLFLVNAETEVGSVEFRFPQGQTLEAGLLRDQLAMAGPGLGQRVQEWVDFLPLVPDPGLQRFHPPELLRDRRRLLDHYREAGFPQVQVEYEAKLDTASNALGITYIIREGSPRLLDSLVVQDSDGEELDAVLPASLGGQWKAFLEQLRENQGRRLSRSLQIRLQDQVGNWLKDRGYPFPRITGAVEDEEDTVRFRVSVEAGRRSRIARIDLEGNGSLHRSVLAREIPLAEGDRFSQAKLAEGERELMGLDMVRFASGQVVQGPADSLVAVRVRVQEGLPRLVSTQLGYTSRSGISADASWTHRSFLEGARVLEVSTTARTGFLGPEESTAKRYGVSVLLRQPYFFHRRVAAMTRPFTEFRDDLRDRSLEAGVENSLLFERGRGRTLALRYSLTFRDILDPRAGGTIGQDQALVDVLRSLDTLNLDRRTSSLALSAQWGPHGSPEPEAWNWQVHSTAEVAGPPGLSNVEYGKLVAEASAGTAVLPWLRVALRAGFGRVLPYGVSVPAPDGSDRLEVYLKLRDATLTAGGSGDVRGWGNELLGPKLPDFRIRDGQEASVRAGRYIPLGGLARWTGSVQLEFPFPFLGWPHGTHLFLDGGRVWTPDGRFLPTAEPLVPGQVRARARYGAGLGVSFSTPVGPIQLDLGYKLNPSPLDLRSPGAVARALGAEESLESVPEDAFRRWHLHFSIGRVR